MFHCFQILDEHGDALAGAPCYKTEEEARAHPPQWWTDKEAATDAKDADSVRLTTQESTGYPAQLITFNLWKIAGSLLAGLAAGGILHAVLMRNLDAQNLMNDTTDINQYTGDQHVALPTR